MGVSARIGVLIENGDTAAVPSLPPEGLEKCLGGSDQVVVLQAPSWTGHEAEARIGALCREQRLNRVVIFGASRGTGLTPEWIQVEDGPWIPVTWAVAGQGGASVEQGKEDRAARARRLLEMAVVRARGTEPCSTTKVTAEHSVAVAGNNHAAFRMASVLLEAGFPVVLLRTGASDACFYRISSELVEAVTSHANVQMVADASIEHVEGHVGNFRLRVGTPGGRRFLRVGAFVVAVDAQVGPLDLDTMEPSERVMSLREYGEVVRDGKLDGKAVCIWLDRHGLDRRCAGQAALASALEHARREGKPTLLFRQIPVYGHGGQVLYDDARAAGVTVIRYDAAPRFSSVNGSVQVTVTDAALPDGALEFAVDRLVVAARVQPPESHARLAAIVRQPLDIEGYLQPGNVRHRPVGSARRGVYFVGGCHDACDPEEAGLEAQAVLADLMALLPDGKTIPVPVERVVVDTEKCAACLTCYRACPHGAIQPNTSQHRMDILDPACWQCGICVAVCPGRALEHGSLRRRHMHEVLQVAAQEMLGRRPIIAFACRQSAVRAAEVADHAGLALPADVLLVDVPCAGLVEEPFVLDALELGARGVLVLGCHHDNCRSLWGSDLSRKRVDKVRRGLASIGVERERVRFHALAANEPHRLAHVLAEASQTMPAGRISE
jgi:heterodisulfide reductase subunit A-like polyferredoxin/coenzyme F420-reducing hydrogenase delta subunit